MAKRTAHSVALSLKSKIKKLISLTKPAKSPKSASKRQNTNQEQQAPPVTIKPAAPEESDIRRKGNEVPDPPRKVGSPAELEAPPQELQMSLPEIHEGSTAAKSSVVSKVAAEAERARADSVTIVPSPGADDAEKTHPGMASIDSPTENFLTIPCGPELEAQLRTAVLRHRSLKTLEEDADLQLGFLEDQANTISRQIQGLQDDIKHIQSGPVDQQQASEVTALYNAIADLRKAEDDAWQRQQRLIRHMSGLYQDFRDEQCGFLDTIDTMLVGRHLIPPKAPTISTDSQIDSSTILSTQKIKVSPTTIKEPFASNDGSDLLGVEATKRARLLNDFIAKRRHLGACEQRFDTKDHLFDELEDSRMQQLEAGEQVEAATEFDLYLFQETQQMTRDLIDAEAEYELSKAAAVAAGIHLRYSDMESGFVDDVDDGYRMSLERDMVEDCDREGIEDWLMEIEEKTCPTRYLSVRDFAGTTSEVGAGNLLRDIDLSDSVSLVAEGPSRRRIDKWSAQFA